MIVLNGNVFLIINVFIKQSRTNYIC